MLELEDPLWMLQILEAVFAHVAEAAAISRPFGQRLSHHLRGCGGKERLAPVRESPNPSAAVHGGAVVVTLAQVRLAGVQAHPHPQLRILRGANPKSEIPNPQSLEALLAQLAPHLGVITSELGLDQNEHDNAAELADPTPVAPTRHRGPDRNGPHERRH